MIAIEADLVETDTTPNKHLEPFHKKHPEAKLDIACYNGPNNYVVAGSTVDIELLELYLNGKKSSGDKLRFKVLRGMHAYHSVMADPIVDECAKLSASIPFQVSVETYIMKLQELPFTDSLTLQPCPTCPANR
jgi:malonyl CoA-acyl carrier protein transacylase